MIFSKSSKICMFVFFGLFVSVVFLNSDDKEKDKNKKKSKEESLVGEPKVIIDSGIGQFDWKGKNNYNKAPNTNRKEAVKEVESKIDCPSCDSKEIPVFTLTSQRIAIDYDFCEHFIGDSPYSSDLWACSVCGYTAYRKTFSSELIDEDKSFVKKYLTEVMHKDIKAEFGTLFKDLTKKPLSQKIIPTATKVKNNVSFIEHANDIDEKWKAYYYVRAVYTMRNLIAQTISCTSLNNSLIEISKQTDSQIKITEDDKQMPYVAAFYLNFYLSILESYKDNSKERAVLHILIAQCYNRLGYYTETKNNLVKAIDICNKIKDMNDAIRSINKLIEAIELEKQCALKAISSMKDALENKLDYGNNKIAIVYLIGELSRRTENFQDAYLFLSASKILFPNENPIHNWVEDHLKRKELKNDEFLLLTPPAYLKQIVIDHNNKK